MSLSERAFNKGKSRATTTLLLGLTVSAAAAAASYQHGGRTLFALSAQSALAGSNSVKYWPGIIDSWTRGALSLEFQDSTIDMAPTAATKETTTAVRGGRKSSLTSAASGGKPKPTVGVSTGGGRGSGGVNLPKVSNNNGGGRRAGLTAEDRARHAAEKKAALAANKEEREREKKAKQAAKVLEKKEKARRTAAEAAARKQTELDKALERVAKLRGQHEAWEAKAKEGLAMDLRTPEGKEGEKPVNVGEEEAGNTGGDMGDKGGDDDKETDGEIGHHHKRGVAVEESIERKVAASPVKKGTSTNKRVQLSQTPDRTGRGGSAWVSELPGRNLFGAEEGGGGGILPTPNTVRERAEAWKRDKDAAARAIFGGGNGATEEVQVEDVDEGDEDSGIEVEESDDASMHSSKGGDKAESVTSADVKEWNHKDDGVEHGECLGEGRDEAKQTEDNATGGNGSKGVEGDELAAYLARMEEKKLRLSGKVVTPATSTPFTFGSGAQASFSMGSGTSGGAPKSSLKTSSYKGVQHGAVPTNDVPVEGKTVYTPPENNNRGFISVGYEKVKGVEISDIMLAHTAAILEQCHKICPDVEMVCQEEGITLPAVRSHIVKEGFPASNAVLQQYAHVKNQWQLNMSDPREPKEGEKPRLDCVWATVLLEGPCDIKRLIETVRLDLRTLGVRASWKQLQEKESDICFQIYGVPGSTCARGVTMTVEWHLSKEEKRMCDKQLQPFAFHGEPLPKMNCFMQPAKDGNLGASYSKFTLTKDNTYKNVGLKVFTVELSPGGMARMGPVMAHMHRTGVMRRALGRRAHVRQTGGGGGRSSADIIDEQRDKLAQLDYTKCLSYMSCGEIVTLDREVEVLRQDGGKTKKFVSLRDEILMLTGPDSNQFIFDGAIPIQQGLNTGNVELWLRHEKLPDVARVAANFCRAPAAFMYNLWSMKYDEGSVRRLMGNFDIGAATLASNSTFDPKTMMVESEFARPLSFAEAMAADMELDDVPEEEVGVGGIDFAAMARQQMHDDMNARDNVEIGGSKDRSFGSREGPSRRSDFQQSVGNSTNRSSNTQRFQEKHRERALENANLRKKNAEAKDREQELLEQIRAMQALMAQGNSSGSPPDSGRPEAGNTPPPPNIGEGGSASGQA